MCLCRAEDRRRVWQGPTTLSIGLLVWHASKPDCRIAWCACDAMYGGLDNLRVLCGANLACSTTGATWMQYG